MMGNPLHEHAHKAPSTLSLFSSTSESSHGDIIATASVIKIVELLIQDLDAVHHVNLGEAARLQGPRRKHQALADHLDRIPLTGSSHLVPLRLAPETPGKQCTALRILQQVTNAFRRKRNDSSSQ